MTYLLQKICQNFFLTRILEFLKNVDFCSEFLGFFSVFFSNVLGIFSKWVTSTLQKFKHFRHITQIFSPSAKISKNTRRGVWGIFSGGFYWQGVPKNATKFVCWENKKIEHENKNKIWLFFLEKIFLKFWKIIFFLKIPKDLKILNYTDDRYVNGGVRFDNDVIEEGTASGAASGGVGTPKKIAGFRRRQSGYGIAISRWELVLKYLKIRFLLKIWVQEAVFSNLEFLDKSLSR